MIKKKNERRLSQGSNILTYFAYHFVVKKTKQCPKQGTTNFQYKIKWHVVNNNAYFH